MIENVLLVDGYLDHADQRLLQEPQSRIRFAFSGLVPKEAVDDGVHGLAALIDGFWWRFTIDPDMTDLEQAKRICRSFVQRYVSACAPNARPRSR